MRSTVVRHELAVGTFIIVAGLLGGAGFVIKSRERGLLDTRTYSFVVPDGSGLQAGSPVLMNGIQVGQIGDVELTGDNRVRVTCQVAPRFAEHIRRDAVATVIQPPLLGSTKVELSSGVARETASSGQELGTGQETSIMERVVEIGARVEGVVARIDTFVATADRAVNAVQRIADRIEAGEGFLGRLIRDEQFANDASATLQSVREVMRDVQEGNGALALAIRDERFAEDLRTTATDVRALVDGLERGEGTLGRLFRDPALADEATGLLQDARGAIARLNDLNTQTQASIGKVQELLDSANRAVGNVDGLIGSARGVTDELRDTIHRVNQGEGTIAALLNDDAVYRETRSLLRELRESVEDLREQAPINSFIGVVFSAF